MARHKIDEFSLNEMNTLLSVYELPNRLKTLSTIKDRVGIAYSSESSIIENLISEGLLTEKTEIIEDKEIKQYFLSETAVELCRHIYANEEIFYAYWVDRQGLSLIKAKEYYNETYKSLNKDILDIMNRYNQTHKPNFRRDILKLEDGKYSIPFVIYMTKNSKPIGELSMAHTAFGNPALLIVENNEIFIYLTRKYINRTAHDGKRRKAHAKSISISDGANGWRKVDFVDRKYFVIPYSAVDESISDYKNRRIIASVTVSVKDMRDIEAVMAICFDQTMIKKL